jgi:hypothetical protein
MLPARDAPALHGSVGKPRRVAPSPSRLNAALTLFYKALPVVVYWIVEQTVLHS